jgi:hypothetical protein
LEFLRRVRLTLPHSLLRQRPARGVCRLGEGVGARIVRDPNLRPPREQAYRPAQAVYFAPPNNRREVSTMSEKEGRRVEDDSLRETRSTTGAILTSVVSGAAGAATTQAIGALKKKPKKK